MTLTDLIIAGLILIAVIFTLYRLAGAYAPWILGNQFPEREAREEREKVLVERIEELERKNKYQEQEMTRQIERLRLTVEVLTEQNSERGEQIAELKRRIVELEKELATLQRHQPPPNTKANMSVLGIWPVVPGQSALDQQGEADALYDAGYTYVALRDARATRGGVIWEVDRVHPTIIQVGGHGDRNGIMLSDGIAEPGWWAELVAGKQIQLMVLLSCDSSQQDEYNISDALIRAGVKAVISCDGQIDDDDAVKFTRFLYGKLAEGLPLTQAIQRAKLAVPRKSAEMIRLRDVA